MQSFRPSHLWLVAISLALLTVWSSAAPTEIPDEEKDSISLADPPVTDLAPDVTTEDRPVWPGFGGWSSFINSIPRRRGSSPGEKPPGPSRSGRRGGNQQLQAGPRRGRGERPVAPPLADIPEDTDVSDPLQKVFAKLEEQGIEGGRFGRVHGQGGRRGGKKKVDPVASGEVKVKSEGRRSGSRSEKNKVKDEVAETETEVETSGAETPEPCMDVLETRAGSAVDTVAALLDNIDNPDMLRPILEDLDANVNGSQEDEEEEEEV